MTLLTLYADGVTVPSVPIPAGSQLTSLLNCTDNPDVLVYDSELACTDEAELPVYTTALSCNDTGPRVTSRLVCTNAANVLTIRSERACDGPPAFFEEP